MATVPALAQAQTPAACVSRAEANALFANTLPDLVDGLGKKCAASLPANAFLTSQGAALVERYRASPSADWSLARSGFVKMMGDKDQTATKMMSAMPDEAMKGFLGTAFSVALAEEIKPRDCPTVDRFIAALSPLPVSNVATIITELMILGGADKDDSFAICNES